MGHILIPTGCGARHAIRKKNVARRTVVSLVLVITLPGPVNVKVVRPRDRPTVKEGAITTQTVLAGRCSNSRTAAGSKRRGFPHILIPTGCGARHAISNREIGGPLLLLIRYWVSIDNVKI